MRDLEQIARLPGVRSAVQADLAGALVDAIREADGETSAAVAGFLSATLLGAGEQLGLGALRRVTLQAPARAALLLVGEGAVVAATVEPPGALAAVEKALENPNPRER